MEKKKLDVVKILFLIIAMFTILLQISPPRTPEDKATSVIFFFGLLFYIVILYGISYFMDKVRSYTDQINQNKKEILEIKEKMSLEKKFNDMDKRISILEVLKKGKKNKKGQLQIILNPRILAIIVLLVLFYLYLRSMGIIK